MTVGNKHYKAGKLACKDGLPTDECHLKGLDKKHWLEGWYDQYYGQKWEPKDTYEGVRIWPVPL